MRKVRDLRQDIPKATDRSAYDQDLLIKWLSASIPEQENPLTF